MKQTAVDRTHARTQVRARDVYQTIDEPTERGGSDLCPSLTETTPAALSGCTNVIFQAHCLRDGGEMGDMKIALTTRFNWFGTMLQEEVGVPFNDVVPDIDVANMPFARPELEILLPKAKWRWTRIIRYAAPSACKILAARI